MRLVVDSEHLGDGLSHNADSGKLRGGTAGLLGDAKLRELKLEVVELFLEIGLRLVAKFVNLDPGCKL